MDLSDLTHAERAKYRSITGHFDTVYNEGMEFAKELLEREPYKGAEMILALHAYLDFKLALLGPIDAAASCRQLNNESTRGTRPVAENAAY